MTATTPLRVVRLVLPMAPDMELLASQLASRIAGWMEMSAERVGEVEMAVVEACINAFEHSRADDRTVEIIYRVTNGAESARLEIEVLDHGVGFVPSELDALPTERKPVGGKKRGWGLRIIRGLMDDVRIRSGPEGTSVVMSKSR